MQITIDIRSEAVHKLLRKSPAAAGNAVAGAINDSSALYLRELKIYPEQRPGSSYVRTRTLGRS